MSEAATFVTVLLAAYAVGSAVASLAVALAWRSNAVRASERTALVLGLRLLPAAAGMALALGIVAPAFLALEPTGEAERVGPLALVLAAVAAGLVLRGLAAGASALRATRRLLAATVVRGRRGDVAIVDADGPLVAVVGAWRLHILADRRVLDVCSPREFDAVLGHEAAHVAARDNLKRLLQLAAPDPLAWLPVGAKISARWRVLAEYAADERACGDDRSRRVELASALIKVARLSRAARPCECALAMPVAGAELAGRVRRLLGPSRPAAAGAPRGRSVNVLAACSLAFLAAVPAYPSVQRAVEFLVALGR